MEVCQPLLALRFNTAIPQMREKRKKATIQHYAKQQYHVLKSQKPPRTLAKASKTKWFVVVIVLCMNE
jgi:hypothetical protein